MEYEWDPGKAAENLRKHNVDFADPSLNILFVVHCERAENRIRIIYARKSDRKETEQYFQGLSHE